MDVVHLFSSIWRCGKWRFEDVGGGGGGGGGGGVELTHSGGAYGEEVATSRADDNRCQQSTRFYSSGEEWVSGWVDEVGGGGEC